MRAVTVCEDIGPRPVKMADGSVDKLTVWRMLPGTAWKQDPETKGHTVVEVDERTVKRAEYAYCLFWIDGRTVAEFHVGEERYAQPIMGDTRAKAPAMKPAKAAAPKREAPGVAPPVAREQPAPKPAPRPSEDGPRKPHRRAGPRGGLKLR